jgi:hypothetical protein
MKTSASPARDQERRHEKRRPDREREQPEVHRVALERHAHHRRDQDHLDDRGDDHEQPGAALGVWIARTGHGEHRTSRPGERPHGAS